jgi:WD40 repeat protein
VITKSTALNATLFLVAVQIAFFLFSFPAHGQQSPQSLPGISLVWSHNVGGLRSFSLSQHARRLALMTDEGKLALWTAQEGIPVWATGKQTNSEVAVSDGVGYVLSYDDRALLKEEVVLRRADTGAVVWKRTFGSAVWSAAFSQDGNLLALGTGDDNLSLINLVQSEDLTTIPIIGTPVSVVFDPSSTKVYVGHWDRSGVSCFSISGKNLWNASGEMDRTYRIAQVGPRFITYIGSSNRRGLSPVAYVVRTENGTLLWAYSFGDDNQDATASTNDIAAITAISYAAPHLLSSGSVTEQRLCVIDRSGQVQWQKGGLFWAPTLICLTPDQDGMVVYDGQRTLYRLDSEGRTVAKAFLSDVLKAWSVSTDDTSLVVYTHDGQLSLLHVQ